jgi:hypothetical protein
MLSRSAGAGGSCDHGTGVEGRGCAVHVIVRAVQVWHATASGCRHVKLTLGALVPWSIADVGELAVVAICEDQIGDPIP